ncbi:peptidoglycan DD-metalloendopeptidase family protein [Allosaccharopolyspora coralli]|uniref:Peptidoglycan DD-metalloendopeptidase family protein n=1 Tax=Allosaccharopolyspora coralli TaxID=2665642 RepID=A0A5Q3QIW8_9PSEU|nr:M23 family metallopeptidase [Allosaccharopolyspora coralli]QGK70787.1 peptidoglycan DD-metalloendopeptidase family protein [Allosaccharopolyspora coralli]
MGKHRQEDRHTPMSAASENSPDHSTPEKSGPGQGKPLRNKVLAAVVATGAFVAIGQPLAANAGGGDDRPFEPVAAQQNLGQAVNGDRQQPVDAPEILKSKAAADAAAEQAKMQKAQAMQQERERAEAERAEQARVEQERQQQAEAERQQQAEAEAQQQQEAEAQQAAASSNQAGATNSSGYAKPAEGEFTSGYGQRSGSSHNGIDVANSIGTPIYSTTGGEVINAGSASGFGQWVRVQHDDGTITVYGHVDTIDVSEGQQVEAGEQIATMGNKGQSTGPHLHFEVIEGGSKINPVPWLEERGISY